MSRHTLTAGVFAAFLLLPGVGIAQRGARTQSDRPTELMNKDDAPKGPTLRVRDVEDMSPIKRLIDKRKDLKLSDTQLNQLKDSDAKLKQQNEPLLKAIDSLIHEVKQAANSTSQEARAKGRDATMMLHGTLQQIAQNYDAAAAAATTSLDADQQNKAKEILAKLKEDNDQMLKERMNSGEKRGG